MKLTLLNGDVLTLDDSRTIEERLYQVQCVLNLYPNMELEDNWHNPRVAFLLEGLANYLVWYKEEEDLYKHDKDILSKNKTHKINSYDKGNIPFSSLSVQDQNELGIGEVDYEG